MSPYLKSLHFSFVICKGKAMSSSVSEEWLRCQWTTGMTCSSHKSAGKSGCDGYHLNDDIGLRLIRSLTGLGFFIQYISWGIFWVYDMDRRKMYILYRRWWVPNQKKKKTMNLHPPDGVFLNVSGEKYLNRSICIYNYIYNYVICCKELPASQRKLEWKL